MGFRQFEPLKATMRDLDRKATQLISNARLPHWVPADAWREGQAYRVELDLPGVDPASIDVQVEPSTVTVTAHRRSSVHADDGAERQQIATELPRGPFSRRLVLGEGLDLEAVEARYADGVLHLTIPLAPASRPRRIKVDAGGQQPPQQQGAGEQTGEVGQQPGGGETVADGPAPEPTGEAGRSEGQTYDPSI
jgi:HSP20 family protein